MVARLPVWFSAGRGLGKAAGLLDVHVRLVADLGGRGGRRLRLLGLRRGRKHSNGKDSTEYREKRKAQNPHQIYSPSRVWRLDFLLGCGDQAPTIIAASGGYTKEK
jgi:hypothetical protein